MLATAVSELARNILLHAGTGELTLELVGAPPRGIRVVARDDGPGIPNVDRALQDRYSTNGGLGLGLPAARKATDSFHIESSQGQGTIVVAEKWLARPRPSHTTHANE